MGNPSQEVHDLKEGERRFSLTAIFAIKMVTWKFNVDETTNGRYDMIIGIYLLNKLGLGLKFSNDVIYLAEKDHMKGVPHL